MISSPARHYKVLVSRLMVGGRLFSKGDIITSDSLTSLAEVVRSGALVQVPGEIESNPSIGILLDLDEPTPTPAFAKAAL